MEKSADTKTLSEAVKESLKYLSRKDNDFFDKLTSRFTIALLVVFFVFLIAITNSEVAINCFTPKEFEDNWIKYVDNFCWTQNTYHVPMDQQLPTRVESGGAFKVPPPKLTYYQWTPLIVLAMMVTFSLPVGFWTVAVDGNGYHIQRLIKAANDKDIKARFIADHLFRHFRYLRNSKKGLSIGNGIYLYLSYVATKCLFIAVPILNLYCLSLMMGDGYSDYGVRALKGYIGTGNYTENPMFPKVTLCDFKIRGLGENLRPYTVQCLLGVNLFNERIFFVIWWWLVLLPSLSFIGLLVFLLRTLVIKKGLELITRLINAEEDGRQVGQEEIEDFVEFLGKDGVLCLQILDQNSPPPKTVKFVFELFKLWRKRKQNVDEEDGHSPYS